ncbi:Xyloglucan galactosyltransferase KATAMARI, partial [Ananas comosus]
QRGGGGDGDGGGGGDRGCEGRRIHIRELPARFNTELLRGCDAFSQWEVVGGEFCAYLANHGLGPRTHNRSRSWYRTDARLLEPFFHRRLLEYPCLTPDPSAADAIFLPYYGALDALPYLLLLNDNASAALHGAPLARLLRSDRPALLRRRAGHDHFLVLAGPAWDFSQHPRADPPLWGTSFLRLPDLLNLTVLVLESRPPHSRWQEHAVPHPTSFHPHSLPRLAAWLARAARSPRPTLMLFAGGGASSPSAAAAARPNNIRSAILAECAERPDLCALPPGDTPARRSTFDAVIAGCIPVFFEDAAARAHYGWHLPRSRYADFSVLVPKEDVVFGGLRIADVLAAVPPAEVRRMRARVLELAPRVMYRRHGSSPDLRAIKDAFDLAIDGVLRRINRRVRAIEEGDPDRIYYQDDDDDDDDDDDRNDDV